MTHKTHTSETFMCPNCGGEVPIKAYACPHCGSDEETGWSQDAAYDDLDLPQGYRSDQDYESPNEPIHQSRASQIGIAVIAVILILSFLLLIL